MNFPTFVAENQSKYNFIMKTGTKHNGIVFTYRTPRSTKSIIKEIEEMDYGGFGTDMANLRADTQNVRRDICRAFRLAGEKLRRGESLKAR